MTTPADLLVERIRREGAIPFDAFVDTALYGPGGFFERGHGAGRAGRDFVTSPEVGPLFGALVARAVDRVWSDLERPDPFVVVEAGAGRGRLAADFLAAGPECAPALRYVLVERSAELREAQRELLVLEPGEDALGPVTRDPDDDPGDELRRAPATGVGPIATSLADLPAVACTGVVLANELLDNLPFRVVERTVDGWAEVRVASEDGGFSEVTVPAAPELEVAAALAAGEVGEEAVPVGARLPVPLAARDWFQECGEILRDGALIVLDYAAPAAELLQRGVSGWLRTYRGHRRGGSPLDDPGGQDITIDLPVEFLAHAASTAGMTLQSNASQADWLRGLGIDDLVDEARAAWDERAHVGDLEALRHRSRVSEAAALLDPAGLGAHRVLVFSVGTRARA